MEIYTNYVISKSKRQGYINNSCGHVVRDFESEAKTRCSFQFL